MMTASEPTPLNAFSSSSFFFRRWSQNIENESLVTKRATKRKKNFFELFELPEPSSSAPPLLPPPSRALCPLAKIASQPPLRSPPRERPAAALLESHSLLRCSPLSRRRRRCSRPLLLSRSLRTRALTSSAAVAAMSSSAAKIKRVLIPIADGTEEMEAVIVADVLRRAGAEVSLASVEEGSEGGKRHARKEVVCSRGIRIVADVLLSEVDAEDLFFDAVVLPGGMPGAERLRDCRRLAALLERHRSRAEAETPSSSDGIILAAICAAPQVVFDAPGRKILDGKKATAHPAFSSKLKDASAAEARVVVDGNVVTSRGPGTAFEFSLCLVEKLFGKEKAEEVAWPMVVAKGAEEPLVVSK